MALHGIGLRAPHYSTALTSGLGVGLVEVISENFMNRGGRPLAVLERVRRDASVVLHGVSLSLGGFDPISDDYVAALDALCRRVEPSWVSDHLSFGTWEGRRGYDLWPLPFTEEALSHVARRLDEVQHRLQRPFVLENASTYVTSTHDEMGEGAFLAELVKRTGCQLLLDVNNLYVNAQNHGFDAVDVITLLPAGCVRQAHLAGHSVEDGYLFDTHGGPVADPVWALYEVLVRTHGPVDTIIEWDENVPSLERLRAEAARARDVEQRVVGGSTKGVAA